MADSHSYVLLMCILASSASAVHGQPQSGFISIDCGITEGYSYVDKDTGLKYTSDEEYVDTGINKIFPPESRANFSEKYYNLRSFPSGTRNCYTLKPVVKGNKYLVRAFFVYGNYDGVNTPPKFHLYIGVNLWNWVDATYGHHEEIITVALADYMSVCLVNTGNGTPFISTLELRPLPNNTYTLATKSQFLLLYKRRNDYGSINWLTRFPDDMYDRMWFATSDDKKDWVKINTTSQVNSDTGDVFQTPSAVLQTAVTTTNLSSSLDFAMDASDSDKIYVYMHFAELTPSESNKSREFDVYLNGVRWNSGFKSTYLKAGHIITNRSEPKAVATYNFSIRATSNSSRPPILNAIELYSLKPLEALPTDDGDADAILDIKAAYKVERNWMGDPCAPAAYRWEGLSCNINVTSQSPRIIAINLTSSGLTGGIPDAFTKLTALKDLDLSHNGLTGTIPDFLGELPFLQYLNLAGNQLTGSLPPLLYERSINGSLLLRLEGNTDLCYKKGSCGAKRKKNIILVAVAVAVTSVLLCLATIALWRMKRRRQLQVSNKCPPDLLKHNTSFTYQEITQITNNFQKQIGRGGFGYVYYGQLEDGTEVAVKVLSESSSQGMKEFQTEALLLTRIHHRNLVSLLGYCNDNDKLALVYEFVVEGNLTEHLRGKSGRNNVLRWRVRLKIALEAAQGLEYLHKGCKPPIIHRDVKTANILLSQNLEAKLADFGLSRAFINEELTHISTAVAGTPGYLDPECYYTSNLNEKSDVYSFGVVLLELITGQPVVLDGPEKTHIVRWVQPMLERGDIGRIVDPRLGEDYDTNSVWKAVEIAMSCVGAASTHRPNMSDVVIQLKECLALKSNARETTDFLDGDSLDFIAMDPLPLNSSELNPTAR